MFNTDCSLIKENIANDLSVSCVTNDPPLLCCRAVQGVQELQLNVRDCVGTGALSGQPTEALVGEAAQQVYEAVQRPGGPDGPVTQHEQIPAARQQWAEPATYREYLGALVLDIS